MSRLARALLLTLGLGVVAALVGQFNAGTTRAVAIEGVNILNSASNPVPVTGTVTATQSGPWKVGIDGTPTVNVATAPPVNVNFPGTIGINGTVPVQNAPGLLGFTPLVQQDFENPARTAFQASCNTNSMVSTCTLPTVPTTKTLVIETVSAAVDIPARSDGSSSGPLLVAWLTTTAGGVSAKHYFAPVLTGSDGASFSYVVNTTVRIYAEPGSSIGTAVGIASSFTPQVSWTISGHFVCTNYQQIC